MIHLRFHHIAKSSARKTRSNDVGVLMHTEKNYLCYIAAILKLLRNIYPTHSRHRDIQNDHIGVEFNDCFESALTVGHHSDYFEGIFQQRGNDAQHRLQIIRHNHARPGHFASIPKVFTLFRWWNETREQVRPAY